MEGASCKRNSMDAANNTGAAVKRKEDMHKMAEANKAFRSLQMVIRSLLTQDVLHRLCSRPDTFYRR